jgi:eukaryotic-like serine/threonine-protein kinase
VDTFDRIGKCKVLATLGKGAHSTILHVLREADSREYALKVVSIDDKEQMKFVDQARHEFRVAQLLSHPNLIKIYCLEIQKDWLFRVRKANLAIEFVNGRTLDLVPLPLKLLVPLFAQVASALVHMHRRGVFHADMKPNNIMYGKRGEVKIIDYGLAWIKKETKDRVQGTPEYMAPETAKSKIVNEKTDIYNFGATLYRMTAMRFPPSCVSATERLKGMSERTWKAMFVPAGEVNRNVPKDLCDLMRRCMAFNPQNRPEGMLDVYETLKRIADEMGSVVEGSHPGV